MSWVDNIITVDHENREVTVRNKKGEERVFSGYCVLKNAYDTMVIVQKVAFEGGKVPLRGGSRRKDYLEFAKNIGCTPLHFKKVFNAIMKQLWITPVEKYVQRYAFGKIPYHIEKKGSFSKIACGIGVNSRIVDRIWERRAILEQTEKDGQKNIQPFVLYSGLVPAELKKVFGKGLWKKVCNSSYTRNLASAKYLFSGGVVSEGYTVEVKELRILFDIPLIYLKRGRNSPVPFNITGLALVNFHKRGDIKIDNAPSVFGGVRSDVENTVRDTLRMANQLDKPFNPGWSLRKMEEKHKEYTHEINRQLYSDERFEWLDSSQWVIENYSETVDDEIFELRLLDNALAIRNEGQSQRHCVGSYSTQAARGSYMVYQVYRDGKHYSTFGVNVYGDRLRYSQQYQFANKRVDDIAESVAENLLKEMRKNFSKGVDEKSEAA